MRVRVFDFKGTAKEYEKFVTSPFGAALVNRVKNQTVQVSESDFNPDADDEAAQLADAETSAPPASGEPGAVPGVSEDGQSAVREQLTNNPASDLFEQFLAKTTTWPSVKVHGIKIRRSPAGAPLDFTRYLRVRREGSQLGAFAYVHPTSGLIEPRLRYDTDAELHAIAPRARRHTKSHPEYRVVINIVDQESLDQAVALARLAYDRT